MPRTLLDDNFAKTVRRPERGFLEFTDERIRPWQVRVYPDRISGSLRYQPLGSKVKKRFPLGDHPNITMAEMRRRAEKAVGQFRSGADPAAERQAVKAERQRVESEAKRTIGMLLDLYYPALAREKASWEQDKGYLDRDVRPHWGEKLPGEITKADCSTRLQLVAQRAPVAANRLRAAMLRFFAWCVDQGHINDTPMNGVKKPTRERKTEIDRVLSDGELVVLWRAIEATPMIPSTRAALKVVALTGKRPAEIAGLAISELRHLDDQANALADIPGSRMKNRRRHVLPLVPQVVALIRERIDAGMAEAEVEGREAPEFVFSSRYRDTERLARHSLSQAMRRVITALDPTGDDADIVKSLKRDPPTPRAFRRTMATGMSRLGIPREDRKACLAHVEDDIMGQHYDAHDRAFEKRRAFTIWANHVADLLAGNKSTGATVLQFTKPATSPANNI